MRVLLPVAVATAAIGAAAGCSSDANLRPACGVPAFAWTSGGVALAPLSDATHDLTITVEGDAGFKQQVAGHVETGDDSMTDPLLGA